jgi:hypothetical protein
VSPIRRTDHKARVTDACHCWRTRLSSTMVSETSMDSILAVILGIGLAASCGFRVFAPLLVASAATHAGYLHVAQGFDWIGTWPATIAFAVAAAIEIGAFYIPWVDNLLDAIASPIAMIAGAMLFAAVAVDFDPFLQWSLAIIAGGGSAAVVQAGTVITRAASTGTTAGLANVAVSTFETVASFFFSLMAIVVPVLTLILLMVLVGTMYYVGRRALRKLFSRQGNPGA